MLFVPVEERTEEGFLRQRVGVTVLRVFGSRFLTE
jgi:hypothetical protein